MKNDIYSMNLHQVMRIDKSSYVMRVAGGWLYQGRITNEIAGHTQDEIVQTFVPFDNEFMKVTQK